MTVLLALVVAGGIALALLHLRRGFAAWTLSAAAFLGLLAAAGTRWEVVAAPAAVLGAAALAFGVPSFRRRLVTAHLMPRIAPLLPRMGETERVALEAGTVGFDGQRFSGRPDWSALLAFRPKPLSDAERGFLGGPVERLCEMLDEWEIEQQGDLPEPVWTFLREQGFFGMILPPEYGGLGFSAAAHSAVVTKLASRSITAAVTVMVPNSLGPGELLLHYGTDEQKRLSRACAPARRARAGSPALAASARGRRGRPYAGSPPASRRVRARRFDGESRRLFGQPPWGNGARERRHHP